jgi:hypothetical protein
MFCGIGDARHLYATLAKIHSHTKQNAHLANKRYHFTLLDLKPAILARDLIVFSLLDDMSRLRTGSEEELDTLLVLFYTWAGVIMPAYAYDGLQRTIRQILLGLEKDLMPNWFNIPEQIRPALITELKGWRNGIEQDYPTKKCRRIIVQYQARERLSRKHTLMQYAGVDSDATIACPKGCDMEEMVFLSTGHLLPPRSVIVTREPAYAEVTGAEIDPKRLVPYLDANWKPNPTFVDLEWQKVRDLLFKDPDFGSEPF